MTVMASEAFSRSALAAEGARVRAAYAKRGEAYATWSSWGFVFGIQDRERQVVGLLKRYGLLPLGERSILDVGCGTGSWIRQFVRWGAQPGRVTGVDLLTHKLAEARQRVPPDVRLHLGNAAELPFASASFDLVLQSMMFTSVFDPEVRRGIASEMLRVVKPGGLILWYDFHVNNPRNPDVRRVSKREIRMLFPACRIDLRRVTLAPPLARLLAPRSWLLTYLLSCSRVLCTHYLGAITRRAGPSIP